MLVTVNANRPIGEIFDEIRSHLGLGEPSNIRMLEQVFAEEEAKALR
jgi:hypothetical protein